MHICLIVDYADDNKSLNIKLYENSNLTLDKIKTTSGTFENEVSSIVLG